MVLIKQLLDCIWMAGTVDLGATYLVMCNIIRKR
jgi:hypothetical protein